MTNAQTLIKGTFLSDHPFTPNPPQKPRVFFFHFDKLKNQRGAYVLSGGPLKKRLKN